MKNDIPQCARSIGTSADVRKRVQKIQDSMVEVSKGSLSKRELGYLRVVVRLTIEFLCYIQRGCGHSFCLEYASESTFSGIDSFCGLTRAYKTLKGAVDSGIDWNEVSVKSLPEEFYRVFDKFDKETNFQKKCRLLLDLFKLQIVFAGASYD